MRFWSAEHERIRRVVAAITVLAVVAVAWRIVVWPRTAFPLDDAYIHLAYVRCFLQSHTFCLNPGEPSLGTSSPLWVLLLAIPYALHADMYWAVQAIALASLTLAVWLTVAVVRDGAIALGATVKETFVASVGAGFLLAANGDLHWLAGSGMETTLLFAVGLLGIRLYEKRGFHPLTGVVCGVAFLVRAPGAILAVMLLLLELVRGRRWELWKPLAATFATALPFLVVAYRITGGLLPTTAKGKLLTYVGGGDLDVEEMVHFIGRYTEFQKYLPHNFLLAAAVLVAGAVTCARPKRLVVWFRGAVSRFPGVVALTLWGLFSYATYLWGFRSIGQSGRYVAESQFSIAGGGAFALLVVARKLEEGGAKRWDRLRQRLRNIPAIAGGLACLVCALGLPYWHILYKRNTDHVAATFLKMGSWVHEHVPEDAKVAAFDIGVLRYFGDRYVIDLGGLADKRAWDCLKKHDCGSYSKKEGATYYLYSRDPDADGATGIFRSQLGPKHYLREVPQVTYSFPDYQGPTMNHSLRLELTKADGWFDAPVAAAAFAPRGTALTELHARVDDALEITGVGLDNDTVRFIRGFPYTSRLNVRLKVLAKPAQPYWIHLCYFNDEDRCAIHTHRVVTNDLLRFTDWQPGQEIEDTDLLFVPYEIGDGVLRVKIAVTTSPLWDERYPELYSWVDAGSIRVKQSSMRALAPR